MSTYLRVLTLVAATAFAAIAIYISLVEQPARLVLEAPAALTQWSRSYPAAMKIQGGLALLCGALGAFLSFRTRNWLWLAGAAIAVANWPFTLVWLMPINDVLLSMSAEQAGRGSQSLLVAWGHLHAVRSALGIVAVALFAAALLRDFRWSERRAGQEKYRASMLR
jgi:hypothetical protein